MASGVVLQPGETVYRQVALWIRVQQDGRWAEASHANVLVTDLRLQFATGRVSVLWWSGVVGLDIDLAAEHIILDFGDGQPVSLCLWSLRLPLSGSLRCMGRKRCSPMPDSRVFGPLDIANSPFAEAQSV